MGVNSPQLQGQVSVKELYNDPDFLMLPFDEKGKVLNVIDPEFSALDPIEQNTVIEEFEKPREAQGLSLQEKSNKLLKNIWDVPNNITKGALQGTFNTMSSVDRAGQALSTIPTLGNPNAVSDYLGTQAEHFNNAAEGLQGNVFTKIEPRYNEIHPLKDPLSLPGGIAASLGKTIPYMVPTALATITGGPAAGIATSGLLEGGGQYGDLMQAGVNPQQAILPSIGTGAISGALEYLPIGRLLSKTNSDDLVKKTILEKLKGITKEAGKQGLLEGTTEAGQQVTQNLGAMIAGADRKPFEGVDQAFLQGAAVGGVLGGANSARQKPYPYKAEPQNTNIKKPFTKQVKGEIVGLNSLGNESIPVNEALSNIQDINQQKPLSQEEYNLLTNYLESQKTKATTKLPFNQKKAGKDTEPLSVQEQPQQALSGGVATNQQITTAQNTNPKNLAQAKRIARGKGLDDKNVIQVGDNYFYDETQKQETEEKKTTQEGMEVLNINADTPSSARVEAQKQGYTEAERNQIEYDFNNKSWIINTEREAPITNREYTLQKKKRTNQNVKPEAVPPEAKTKTKETPVINQPQNIQENISEQAKNDNILESKTQKPQGLSDEQKATIKEAVENDTTDLVENEEFKFTDKQQEQIKDIESKQADSQTESKNNKQQIEDQNADTSLLNQDINTGTAVYDVFDAANKGQLKTNKGVKLDITKDQLNDFLDKTKTKDLYKTLQNAIKNNEEVMIDYTAEEPTLNESLKQFAPVGFHVSKDGNILIGGYRMDYETGRPIIVKTDQNGNPVYDYRSFRLDRINQHLKQIKTAKKSQFEGQYTNTKKADILNSIQNSISKATGINQNDIKNGKLDVKQLKSIQEWIRNHKEEWKQICDF